MRALNVIVLGIIVACSAVAIGQSGAPQAAAPGQEGQGRGRGRGGRRGSDNPSGCSDR